MRWHLLEQAVESACAQSLAADVVVVCVDNNEELLARASAAWGSRPGTNVRVIANRDSSHLGGRETHHIAHGTIRRFGAGSARNTAIDIVNSDIVAFLDDDARADPDWLSQLVSVYDNDAIMAVGGAPLPDYETQRPTWFPANFDWVFGCTYDGLPTTVAPLRRLIGANMSVRRSALETIGGFHEIDLDDFDVCERLAGTYGPTCSYYNPQAIVHHHVPRERVSWRYFCRRCYFINREKVRVLKQLGTAGSMTAERAFVWRTLRHRVVADARRGARGDLSAFSAIGAMFVGLGVAAAGHVTGHWRLRRSH